MVKASTASTATMEPAVAVAPQLQGAPAWVLPLAASMVPRAPTPSATPRHPCQEAQSTMLMASLLAQAQEPVLGPPQVLATTATAQAQGWALTHPTTAQAVD